MIGIKVNNTYLDIGKVNIRIEVKNPLFQENNIPGGITYPFNLPAKSKINRSLFKFPEVSSSTAFLSKIENVQLYINNVLWKTGVLNLLSGDSEIYRVNFQADSGDLSEQITSLKLAELDLGSDVLDYSVVDDFYPTVNYALFPIKWDNFFGGKNGAYQGYINYYDGGFIENTTLSYNSIIPFPYVGYLLEKIFSYFGYYLSGSILSDPDFQKLVLINNYAIDKNVSGVNVFDEGDPIDFTNHVPDVTISEFLIALKAKLGITYLINSKHKTVEIVTLKEVINDLAYTQRTSKAEPDPKWGVNDYDGVAFLEEFDSNDQLGEREDTTWTELRLGNAKKVITCNASSLLMNEHVDSIEGARTWNVPWTDMAGSSPMWAIKNDIGIRLMYNQGLQGSPAYPQGHYQTANKSLRWDDGAIGAYYVDFKDWIDFLAFTRPESHKVRYNISDLMDFNPKKKEMINYQKYLWQQIRISVDNQVGIRTADVNYLRVRL